ncbi:hypothetical protein LCGC14_0833230 [marine sediment metagenome]|uniref:Uncharacterized protein n=1 Tax=marine sediment metagenome TaxID=412755 RepID=A0A0F9SML6_9ZZZZ
MNYERDWNNRCNAVGFAAACARLALPFYDGDQRSNLVAAIEIAECYANGEQIDDTDAHRVAGAAVSAAPAGPYPTPHSAWATIAAAAVASVAAYAAYGAANVVNYDSDAAADASADAADAARGADDAGVDSSEIQIAFARWVVRDLSCGRDLDEELRQAAGAAIVAGDEDLARQLIEVVCTR